SDAWQVLQWYRRAGGPLGAAVPGFCRLACGGGAPLREDRDASALSRGHTPWRRLLGERGAPLPLPADPFPPFGPVRDWRFRTRQAEECSAAGGTHRNPVRS